MLSLLDKLSTESSIRDCYWDVSTTTHDPESDNRQYYLLFSKWDSWLTRGWTLKKRAELHSVLAFVEERACDKAMFYEETDFESAALCLHWFPQALDISLQPL